jgi:hypothetical protein
MFPCYQLRYVRARPTDIALRGRQPARHLDLPRWLQDDAGGVFECDCKHIFVSALHGL